MRIRKQRYLHVKGKSYTEMIISNEVTKQITNNKQLLEIIVGIHRHILVNDKNDIRIMHICDKQTNKYLHIDKQTNTQW